MDASARQKAEMAQKIAQELLKSSSHRLASTLQSMPALNTEQSNLVRAAQQKAAEIAVQVPLPFPSLPFPSLPFPSLPFPSLPFPSLPFPSLPFPSLPFPLLLVPFLASLSLCCCMGRVPVVLSLLLLLATHSCYFCLHATCFMTGLVHVAAVLFLT